MSPSFQIRPTALPVHSTSLEYTVNTRSVCVLATIARGACCAPAPTPLRAPGSVPVKTSLNLQLFLLQESIQRTTEAHHPTQVAQQSNTTARCIGCIGASLLHHLPALAHKPDFLSFFKTQKKKYERSGLLQDQTAKKEKAFDTGHLAS